jgi:hypothetical protein
MITRSPTASPEETAARRPDRRSKGNGPPLDPAGSQAGDNAKRGSREHDDRHKLHVGKPRALSVAICLRCEATILPS